MNLFGIALSLLVMSFVFVIAAFAIFWISTEPKIQAYPKLDVIYECLCRLFLVLSGVSGALAVIVVTSALVAPFAGVLEL